MAFNTNQSIVAEYYVAALGRLPDQTGFDFWVGQLDSGMTAESLMGMFFSPDFPEVAERYPEDQTSEETINFIYSSVFGREADAEGLAYWSEKLDSSTKPAILEEMLAVAKDPANIIDGKYLEDQKAIAEEQLIVDPGTPGNTEYLKVSQDNIDGTSNDDTFMSYVSQNQNGQQVNTLGSGDVINGGAGEDTLDAQVTAGAYVNGQASSNMAIAPVTNSVENIVLHAEIADFGETSADNNDTVIVNAKYTNGVETIASNYSDASLVVQNMNTKGTNGTASQTVAMEYTGNKDTNWDESDMTVYYDQDYLVRSAVETNSLYYFTQDRLATQQDDKPFGENTAVDGIKFRVDGETEVVVTIAQDKLDAFLSDVPANGVEAYEEFAGLLAEALALKNVEMDGALDGFEITLDKSFYRTNGGQNNGGDPLDQYAYAIVLTAPDNVDIDQPAMNQTTKFIPTYDMYNDTSAEKKASDTSVAINVDLEKVGLAADGGDLTIGSMNKDGNNIFNANQAITVTDTLAGFDEFNVHVAGDKSKNSSLASLQSTDNTLRKVTIDSKAGSIANLTIGNSNTSSVALDESAENMKAFKDVQIMDASTFAGDLTLNAGFTSEIVAKYLDNVTETTLYGLDDAKTELASFDYNGGNGDDTLNLAFDLDNIVTDNFAHATDTVGLNVFKMDIDGGKGDDTIIVDADAVASASSATNITIDGGLGDDLIDISSNGGSWTYNVAFSGTHFGHDTVAGFDEGAVTVTDEAQNLDLTGFVAHTNETIVVTVGDKTMTFTATADMADTDIATQVDGMLRGSLAGSYEEEHFDGSTNNGTDIDLTNTDANVNEVTVEVRSQVEANGTYDKDTTPIHTATSTTQQQGGLVESATGADTLDFSAYNVDGVLMDNDTTDVVATGSDLSTVGDTFIWLEASAHDATVYNVYKSTVTDTGITNVASVDFSASGNATKGSVIGSINLDADAAGTAIDYNTIDASQLLF